MALKGSVARRYARALLRLAVEQNQVPETGAELADIARFFEQNPELYLQLLSPALSAGDREKFLNRMVELMGLSQATANFILLLSRKGRLEHLPRIRDEFRTLSDQAAGMVRVKVSSARPFPEGLKARLLSALQKRTGKKVEAQFAVEPELLGGLKVQIGSLLLDGSISSQLKRLKEELERS